MQCTVDVKYNLDSPLLDYTRHYNNSQQESAIIQSVRKERINHERPAAATCLYDEEFDIVAVV